MKQRHRSPFQASTVALHMLVLAMAALLPVACNGMPQGNSADGGRWFHLNRCNGCHGEGGRGARGPAIAETNLSFRRFLGKLRSPHSEIMPTFGPDRLSDQDAADIYLWLHAKTREEKLVKE